MAGETDTSLRLIRTGTPRGVSFLVEGPRPLQGLAVEELRRRVLLAERRGRFRGLRCVIAPVYYSDKGHLEVMPRDPAGLEDSTGVGLDRVEELADAVESIWFDVEDTTREYTTGAHGRALEAEEVAHLVENTLPLVRNASEGFGLIGAALRDAGTVGRVGFAGDALHNLGLVDRMAEAFENQSADLAYGITCWKAYREKSTALN